MTTPEAETATEQPDGPAENPRRDPLDARGMERPKFLLSFPDDPALERLIVAFESGNYAYVRQHAEKVAESATSDEVRAAALELRRRINPDPLAVYLLFASVLLLLFLIVWVYFGHEH